MRVVRLVGTLSPEHVADTAAEAWGEAVNRRHFLAGLASALFLPYEPKRVYSFGSEVGRVDPRLYSFQWVYEGRGIAMGRDDMLNFTAGDVLEFPIRGRPMSAEDFRQVRSVITAIDRPNGIITLD